MSASAAATSGFPAIHTGYLTRLDASDQPVDETCLQQANANHLAEYQFLDSTFFLAFQNRQLPASGKASAMAMLAHAMAAGDTYRSVYDPNNGKLQYLYITHADGSKTNWTFDTENQYTWSSAVVDYNPAEQVTDATWNNKDGTYVYQVFDLAHGDAPEWTTQAGFPDGHWIVWTHDTAGTQQWWQTENVWGAGGIQLSETVYWRNGNTEVLAWDPAHGDALQSDTLNTPTGAYQTVWDTAGTDAWSSYTAQFNSGGQIENQTFTDRDGSYLFYTWDTAHGDALSSIVLVGAGKETAQAWYDTANSLSYSQVTTVTDEGGRNVFEDYLNNNGSTHFVSFGTTWKVTSTVLLDPQTSTDRSTLFTATSGGQTEQRVTDAEGHLAGVYDKFTDGTSDITIVATPEDGLAAKTDTLTATFDASGNLKDVIESTTQDDGQHFVMITAAMLQQSIATPGTLAFIENGLKVLLVNPGAGADGIATSEMFWQSVSSNAPAQASGVQPEDFVGAMHYVGAVAGAVSVGIGTSLKGFAAGEEVAAGVGLAATPFGIGFGIVGAAAYGITGALGGWVAGGKLGTQVGNDLEHLMGSGPSDPPAPSVSDFGMLGHI